MIQLTDGSAPGDPEVDFPEGKSASGEDEAFELLRDVVASLNHPHLPGLKSQMRKRQRNFTEKRYGYGGFLQFCKAAQARGYVDMEWDDIAGAYILGPPGSLEKPASAGGEPPAEARADEARADEAPSGRGRATPLIAVPPLADDAPTEPTPVVEAEPPAVVEAAEDASSETPPAEKKKRAPRKSTAKPKATRKTTAKTTAKRSPRTSKTAAKE